MRWIGFATVTLLGTGCSILFNPNNIPDGERDAALADGRVDGKVIDSKLVDAPPDAMFDAPPDVPPGVFALADLYPAVFIEGQGANGSRRATLLVRGQNIEPTATVSIVQRTGPAILVTVHDAEKIISTDGTLLTVPVTIAVDDTRGTGVTVGIDVTVSQMRVTAESQTLSTASITYLPELTAATLPTGMLAPGMYRYSLVDLPSVAASNNSGPLQIRSTSSIKITGAAGFSASGASAGPGGAAGGTGGAGLGGAGGPGAGTGGGKPSGGGAGFTTKGGDGASANTGGMMYGDAPLSNLDMNRSSGGAGGNGGLGAGGAGGGGGGTVELSADGNLTLGSVTANGGNGASGNSQGGGGSGGAILLRAGGAVMVSGAVTATGGSGDGAGSVGRIRLDAPTLAAINAMPALYRGPQWVTATPLVSGSPRPMLTVTGEKLRAFKYYFSNESGSSTQGPFNSVIGMAGTNTFQPMADLFPGGNVLCVEVESTELGRAEARNCITIVYMP